MRFSAEVQNILNEARELADGSGHPLTTAHLLLAMFINENRAASVLGDLRVTHQRIIEAMRQVKRSDRSIVESEELLVAVEDRMLDAARRSDARLVSSLHLLMALTREKASVGYRVFSFMGIPPAQVRTLALARITGPVPRHVQRQQGQRDALYADEPPSPVAVSEGEPQLGPQAQPTPAPPPRRPSSPPRVAAKAGEPVSPFAEPGPDQGQIPLNPASPPPTAEEVDPALLPYILDEDEYPLLTAMGRNLTLEAAHGTLDPCIGRQTLIDAMIDVLNKRRSNNPCLVGDPGVGKTAIVEGLAQVLFEHAERLGAEDPDDLRFADRVIIEIDVGALVAGTELRGSFSRRMARLKDEVKHGGGRVIVFIDELHTLVGAGSGDGALDAANDLKTALARGEFPCIGATTRQEYHKHVERDPALERRFQPIDVEEPSEEQAIAILQGVVDRYEAHHNVMYKGDALSVAVKMSRRYIVDRRLPDKAINLIDTAAARAVRFGKETVEVRDIAEVVSELAAIPVERLMMSDAERILGMRDYMGERVIGHDGVLDLVAEVVQRNSAGFSSKRPIGSFLFLGPTGVGKTETAKILADFLFGSKDAMTRFDMSEFMERHAVSRLLGAAPGYVGHEEAAELTAALKRRPYQIILFDEIEKAHADVLNILLQILDEGHVTDSKGASLTFANTVIVMTSNLGAEALLARRRIGFGAPPGDDSDAPRLDPADRERLLESARKALPPELWGRIEEKCVFEPLGRREVRRIAELLIEESASRLSAERSISYEVTPRVIEYLIDHGGFEAALGARPMRRAVQRICETAVARAILRGEATPGDALQLDVVGDSVMVVE